MTKSILLAFALGGFLFASNMGYKTYHVMLPEPVTLGSAHLQRGSYKLMVEGSKVTFSQHGKQAAQANAQIKTTPAKAEATEVGMRQAGKNERLESIWIRGTRTELQFTKS
jgi:hypothetical protein